MVRPISGRSLHYMTQSGARSRTPQSASPMTSTHEITEAVMDLINKTTEATVPKTTVKSFHNQKPWITRTIWDAINTQTASLETCIYFDRLLHYKDHHTFTYVFVVVFLSSVT